MSSPTDPEYCYWNPTEPACQDIYAQQEPLYISAAPSFTGAEVAFANMTFLLVAAIEGSVNGLIPLYYRVKDWKSTAGSSDGYYKSYTDATGDSTNWWLIASLTKQYGFLAIFGIAFWTQLIGIFGVGEKANVIVWQWVVGFTGTLIASIYLVLMGLAYDKVTTKCRGDTTSSACTVQTELTNDLALFMASTALSFATLKFDLKKWYQSMSDPIKDAKAGKMFAF